jgi:transcriptional regulator with XRE-family HTH domain
MNASPRVSGRKLAQLLGKTPPTVSKALSGGENLTIGTMTEMAEALDAAVYIHVAKKGTLVRWAEEQPDVSTIPVGKTIALDQIAVFPGATLRFGEFFPVSGTPRVPKEPPPLSVAWSLVAPTAQTPNQDALGMR